jgi:histidyl-tRNA synthetase
MRDFLPAEKANRERVLTALRATYRRHGFVEIETPYVENLAHLTSDQGGDNEKMLFKIQKRGLTPADLEAATSPDDLCDLGLRYDLTVPLARYYANNRGKIPDVFRVIQIGPVWRAERPQKGRFRQFTQCDIDVIGDSSSLAEVELMTVTMKAVTELGLADLTLKVNDRRLLSALLRHAGVPPELGPVCLVIIDKLDKIGLDGVGKELAEVVPGDVADKLLASLAEFDSPGFDLAGFRQLIDGPEVEEVAGNLERILAGVRAGLPGYAVDLKFVGSLVRGMGYYSGPIFELWHPSFRGAIAGGGRYDGMIGRFSGKAVPATGFSIGFERMVELTATADQDTVPKVALLYEPGVDWGALVAEQGRLVGEGYAVRLVPKPKRLAGVLDGLAAEGFSRWTEVGVAGSAGILRELS